MRFVGRTCSGRPAEVDLGGPAKASSVEAWARKKYPTFRTRWLLPVNAPLPRPLRGRRPYWEALSPIACAAASRATGTLNRLHDT